LTKNVSVFYNNVVEEVRRFSDGVQVITQDKVFAADAVVVTVPLGVLKRDKIKFDPPLSDRKKTAIKRLGFGNLNKVIMLFHDAFWDSDEGDDIFGCINESQEFRGENYMFYSYSGISGGAQLTALSSGKAAYEHERRSPEENVKKVLEILRKIFEPKGVTVPPPYHCICTSWGADPLAHGAYSSMPVGSIGGEDYDIVGESVGGRLFFAGEATTRKFPATMHGAFYTGLWTAANVDAEFEERLRGKKVLKKHSGQGIGGRVFHANNDPSTREIHTGALHPLKRKEPSHSSVLTPAMIELRKARLHMVFHDPLHPPPIQAGNGKMRGIPGKGPWANYTLVFVDLAPTEEPIYALINSRALLDLSQNVGASTLDRLSEALSEDSIGPHSERVQQFCDAIVAARRGEACIQRDASFYLDQLEKMG